MDKWGEIGRMGCESMGVNGQMLMRYVDKWVIYTWVIKFIHISGSLKLTTHHHYGRSVGAAARRRVLVNIQTIFENGVQCEGLITAFD